METSELWERKGHLMQVEFRVCEFIVFIPFLKILVLKE